jgi:hypothetical protein
MALELLRDKKGQCAVHAQSEVLQPVQIGKTYTMPHAGRFEAKLIVISTDGKETESTESTLFTSPQVQ